MQEVQNILKGLIQSLGLSLKEITETSLAGQTIFVITSDSPKELIGPRGETLRALEYIVRKIAEKRGVSDRHYIIDVDGYRTNQIKELQQKAKIMADRARSFEYDVEMNPMNAYERLIVHATLADIPQINTESRGEGDERRVVIKYTKDSPTEL